eukprot:1158805-Pelagomonas_calceolata.AAC.8
MVAWIPSLGKIPAKRTRSTKRHSSRFLPQQCSQGISGTSIKHNDAHCNTKSDHWYTAAISQNGTLFIPLIHHNIPNSPNTLIDNQDPRNKREKILLIETELQTPTINPLAPTCKGNSIWKRRGIPVKKLAQKATENYAINTINYYDFGITLKYAWRICPAKEHQQ